MNKPKRKNWYICYKIATFSFSELKTGTFVVPVIDSPALNLDIKTGEKIVAGRIVQWPDFRGCNKRSDKR